MTAIPSVVAICGVLFLIQGKMSAGSLVLFLSISSGLISSLSALHSQIERFQEPAAALGRIQSALRVEPEELREDAGGKFAITGNLEASNLRFRYPSEYRLPWPWLSRRRGTSWSRSRDLRSTALGRPFLIHAPADGRDKRREGGAAQLACAEAMPFSNLPSEPMPFANAMGPAIGLDQSANGSPGLLSHDHARDRRQGDMPLHPALAPVENVAIKPEGASAPEQAGPEHMAVFAELLRIHQARRGAAKRIIYYTPRTSGAGQR